MLKRKQFTADIILVCNNLAAGGTERVVSTLANAWSGRGRRVCVITFDDYENFYKLDPAVYHIVLDSSKLPAFFEFLRRIKDRLPPLMPFTFGLRFYLHYKIRLLRRAIKSVAAPTVVSFGTSVNIVTIFACKNRNRRVIISERGDLSRLSGMGQWEKTTRSLYNRADVITANTEGALLSMQPYVEKRKLFFVPNPLAETKTPDTAEARSKHPFVLIVARLVHDKAHDVLLKAFAGVSGELRDWRLAVVGGGKLKEDLQTQASELRITDRVDWYGIVSDPFPFYRAASIFVLPSRFEGTPDALLEAMNCGLAPIVSDASPGPLELVKHLETGMVVPVNDVEALSRAILRLARDRALRERLGEAARRRASDYELPKALARWEAAIGAFNESRAVGL
jgi:GalNAc-alpha-(1->4)-GalNAc-alpha-(1->3)-diNAcBac-PP-undecaprenol alpha-1,4-N-acetyl-D-galactosaminyltransferase